MTAATLGATKGRLIRCTVPGLTPNLAAILKAAERSAPRCGCFDAATAVMPWTPASNLQFIMYPAKALMQPRRLSPWTQSNQRSRRALPWVFDAATAVIAMDTAVSIPELLYIPRPLMQPRRLSPWTLKISSPTGPAYTYFDAATAVIAMDTRTRSSPARLVCTNFDAATAVIAMDTWK